MQWNIMKQNVQPLRVASQLIFRYSQHAWKITSKSWLNVRFEKTYSKVRAYSTAGMGPWSVSSDAMQVQPPQWDLFTAEGMKDGYI